MRINPLLCIRPSVVLKSESHLSAAPTVICSIVLKKNWMSKLGKIIDLFVSIEPYLIRLLFARFIQQTTMIHVSHCTLKNEAKLFLVHLPRPVSCVFLLGQIIWEGDSVSFAGSNSFEGSNLFPL